MVHKIFLTLLTADDMSETKQKYYNFVKCLSILNVYVIINIALLQ